MRVLILPSTYPNTYNPIAGIFFKEQAEALTNSGIEVSVLATVFIQHQTLIKSRKFSFGKIYKKEKGVSLYLYKLPIFPKFHGLKFLIRFWISKHLLKKYIKENGLPDIVHLHTYNSGRLARYLKKKHNINYVVTEHYSYLRKKNMSKKHFNEALVTYQNSTQNYAVSNEFADFLKTKFNTNFNFLPNFINTNFFTLKAKKTSTSQLKFINIGNLVAIKNQELLIKAFFKAFGTQSIHTLKIVGDGPQKASLERLIADLNMQSSIELTGLATRNKIKTLLHDADIFVLSSHKETFGVVLIEAMSCGLPVISTKNGGAESIVTNENLGILCNNDIDSIVQALQDVSNNHYDSNYIRKHIIDNFSEEAIVETLKRIYLKYGKTK